ncbi:MAG: 16S rRNA (uracil(1498)-N(3))-methyltransferase [Pseudomonadota bacterium]
MAHITRLFVDHPLEPGQTVPLDRDHANRMFNVMRHGLGDEVRLFNGRDGEWRAEVTQAGKRAGALLVHGQTAPQRMPPDVWLLFAPIRKERTDFIVEKATELGVARILPVQTDFTQGDRLKQERLQAHAVAAAEQCGGTYVPPVVGLQKLSGCLDAWPRDRQLMFCDEAAKVGDLPRTEGAWAIAIGPEGGFSPPERDRLRALGHTVTLGPRILRADTAAVAALTLWQSQLGDWR